MHLVAPIMPHTAPAPFRRSALHDLLHAVVQRASHRGISAFFAGVALVIAALAVLVAAWRAPAVFGGPAAAAVLVALLRGRAERDGASESSAAQADRPRATRAADPSLPAHGPAARAPWRLAGSGDMALRTAAPCAALAQARVTWHVQRRPARDMEPA